MTTTESNKLIAEFMGQVPKMTDLHEFTDEEPMLVEEYSRPEWYDDKIYNLYGWYDIRHAESMRYHSDWNWLMPVVERIETLGFTFDMSTGVTGFGFKGEPIIDCGGGRKEATYNAVVEFIKWYNENKS